MEMAMSTPMLIFVGALVFAIGGTPVARRIAPRLGVMDQPSTRKVHIRPIPRMGGVAIFIAVMLALVLLQDKRNFDQFVSILLAASWMSFLGLWDDRWGVRPMLKLSAQFLGALFLVQSGIRVALPFLPVWANIGLTLIWLVGVTNAFNLLDNMDGLSGGVAAIAAAFFVLMSAFSGQYLVGALSAAVLGACVGFLVYNYNPASIFMGDSGSLFLGFLLAAIGIKLRFPDNVTFVTWMIPLLVLAIPLFDTTLVVLSRLRRGLNPLTTPGKDHTSHRLVAMNMTQREAVLTLYLASGALGLVAIFVTQASILEGYIAGGGVAMVALYALWRLERDWIKREKQTLKPASSKDDAYANIN
jgi:UDP-GlcNAc:undecaprenyl-phosphate GlcNAc-1-phosphate transferase